MTGSFVTIFPDQRDRHTTNRLGIPAIVFDRTRQALPSIMVCTLAGIISDRTKKKPLVIPPDLYQVMKPGCTIGLELRRLQQQILRGQLDHSKTRYISMREAHFQEFGESTEREGYRCYCGRGNPNSMQLCSTARCKCKKFRRACNKHCSCGDKCCNDNNNTRQGTT